MEIQEYTDRMAELETCNQAILDKCLSEKREPDKEEAKAIDDGIKEFEDMEAGKLRAERVAQMADRNRQSAGRQVKPEVVEEAQAQKTGELSKPNVVQNRGTWDWDHFGAFAKAVQVASLPGRPMDPRLSARLAPTTAGTEGAGADGGFAVPPDFRTAIQELVAAEDSLIGRTDQRSSSSNIFTVPKDATTPWQSTGGVQAYWDGELAQLTQSKPNLTEERIPLDKLTCLIPVSEELLEDAPAMNGYLLSKAPKKMAFKVNLAIVQGTGVGQPTGILNSGCLVTVAQEGSQNDTIVFANVIKMWSRCYAPARLNAVWLINQDIEPQLLAMEFPGTASNSPVYLPAGNIAGSPFATIMGRPVIPTQACETLGDVGDILLVDLSSYLTIQKVGGIRSESSIHLWFDYDTTAFKFIWRIGGRPWYDSAIDPRDGSNTLSPFVTLAVRAG